MKYNPDIGEFEVVGDVVHERKTTVYYRCRNCNHLSEELRLPREKDILPSEVMSDECDNHDWYRSIEGAPALNFVSDLDGHVSAEKLQILEAVKLETKAASANPEEKIKIKAEARKIKEWKKGEGS